MPCNCSMKNINFINIIIVVAIYILHSCKKCPSLFRANFVIIQSLVCVCVCNHHSKMFTLQPNVHEGKVQFERD